MKHLTARKRHGLMDTVDHPNLLADGTITVELNNGKHFTYRIKTIKKGDLEGKRIVSLLTGPNNQRDYKGFAFVNHLGIVCLWRRCQTPAFIKHAQLLDGQAQAHVREWLQEGRCRQCGKVLTDPESIRLGIGPKCGGRV